MERYQNQIISLSTFVRYKMPGEILRQREGQGRLFFLPLDHNVVLMDEMLLRKCNVRVSRFHHLNPTQNMPCALREVSKPSGADYDVVRRKPYQPPLGTFPSGSRPLHTKYLPKLRSFSVRDCQADPSGCRGCEIWFRKQLCFWFPGHRFLGGTELKRLAHHPHLASEYPVDCKRSEEYGRGVASYLTPLRVAINSLDGNEWLGRPVAHSSHPGNPNDQPPPIRSAYCRALASPSRDDCSLYPSLPGANRSKVGVARWQYYGQWLCPSVLLGSFITL